jgi:hypothetical protein
LQAAARRTMPDGFSSVVEWFTTSWSSYWQQWIEDATCKCNKATYTHPDEQQQGMKI